MFTCKKVYEKYLIFVFLLVAVSLKLKYRMGFNFKHVITYTVLPNAEFGLKRCKKYAFYIFLSVFIVNAIETI